VRYVGVVILIALTVAVATLPEPVETSPGEDPVSVAPPVAVCPLLEAGDRVSSASILSSVSGPGRLSGFAAGSLIGEVDFVTGSTGSVTIEAAEIDAVGSAGGLVEMPSETSAAGVVTRGPASLAAEACAETRSTGTFLSGGSTASGARFALQILNPFAGDAIVDLTVATDAGLESDDRFDAVRIPAASAQTLDFTEIVPGRAFISVEASTRQGAVLVVARQGIEDEIAIWNAEEPALGWWLPIPAGTETTELLVASPANAEVQYQVDVYGSDGYEEAFSSGQLSPRALERIPLTDVATGLSGIHVTSSGPVVPTLWIDSPDGLAVTTASPVSATTWLLPGASLPAGGSGRVVVLNTGLEAVSVSVRALGDRALLQEIEVAPEDVSAVALVAADGYRVEATGPVVAMWVASRSGAGAAALGTPLPDG
jgi:hypothetical protein